MTATHRAKEHSTSVTNPEFYNLAICTSLFFFRREVTPERGPYSERLQEVRLHAITIHLPRRGSIQIAEAG